VNQHEPKLSIEQVLAEKAALHKGEPANATVVQRETVEKVLDLIDQKQLADKVPGTDELLRDWVAAAARRLPKLGADRLKSALRSGAATATLDLGDEWGLPILVCGKEALDAMYGTMHTQGRIVALGDLTSTDVQLMRMQQQINLDRQRMSVEDMADRYRALEQLLVKHPDYRSMMAAASATVAG
jgi:hypothetical protein